MIQSYRKKPVVVQAVRYTGYNVPEVAGFIGLSPFDLIPSSGQRGLMIPTLEGVMRAVPGDYIIRGTRGEVYPCKPGPFEDTFELAHLEVD